MPRPQRIAQRPLPFRPPLQAIHVIGANPILHRGGNKIAKIRVIQARSAGMGGRAPAMQVDFVKLIKTGDSGHRPVVLFHPRKNLDPTRFGFRGDFLDRVGSAAGTGLLRLHRNILVEIRMGGDECAGRGGFKKIAVHEEGVDAGPGLHVIKKTRCHRT